MDVVSTLPASSPAPSIVVDPVHQMSPICWSAEPLVVFGANNVASSVATLESTEVPAHRGASFASAASSFSFADFPPPEVSHASSSAGAPFCAASACLM